MITINYVYYENRPMFEELKEWYKDAPDWMHFQFVDDGSTSQPLTAEDKWSENVKIYRTETGNSYHRDAGRNFLMDRTTTDWNIVFDLDHALDPHSQEILLEVLRGVDQSKAYQLPRKATDHGDWSTFKHDPGVRAWPGKTHKDGYVITKDLYWKKGGYNETYNGIYGMGNRFYDLLWSVRGDYDPSQLLEPLLVWQIGTSVSDPDRRSAMMAAKAAGRSMYPTSRHATLPHKTLTVRYDEL